jgi:nucleoside-diphosphate-sugar epimerase
MAVTLYSVIGSGGFIGARVTQTLRADGQEVFAPGRSDEVLGRDLGRVFYCAGLTGDYRTRPFETVEAHAGLLSRILEQGRFERLVYLSSTRVYDANPDANGREEAPLRVNANDPEHLYELSKLLGENLAVNRSGGRGAAARLSYVFDWTADARGFLSDWLRRAAESRDLALDSNPEDGRDYIHRDDAVAGLRAILDSGLNGIVNVAAGRTVTNAELAEIFGAAGWGVSFRRAAQGQASPSPDVSRLAALGVQARDVPALIADYLATLTP